VAGPAATDAQGGQTMNAVERKRQQQQAELVEQFCIWADLPEEMARITPEHLRAVAAELRGHGLASREGTAAAPPLEPIVEGLTAAEGHRVTEAYLVAAGFGGPVEPCREHLQALVRQIARLRRRIRAQREAAKC